MPVHISLYNLPFLSWYLWKFLSSLILEVCGYPYSVFFLSFSDEYDDMGGWDKSEGSLTREVL